MKIVFSRYKRRHFPPRFFQIICTIKNIALTRKLTNNFRLMVVDHLAIFSKTSYSYHFFAFIYTTKKSACASVRNNNIGVLHQFLIFVLRNKIKTFNTSRMISRITNLRHNLVFDISLNNKSFHHLHTTGKITRLCTQCNINHNITINLILPNTQL